MSNKKKLVLALVALSVLVLCVAFWPRGKSSVEISDAKPPGDNSEFESPDGSEFESSDDLIVIGGVSRKRSDVERDGGLGINRSRKNSGKRNPLIDGYGTTPPVAIDANPQVAAAAKAFQENTHPERLSPLVQPAAFDLASYKKNPQPYLDAVEPGRVFQPAQPGEGVAEIRRRSPSYQQVVQGEPVKLAVKAEVGAPVTFTSFDLGRFSNQLTSTTVAANADGLAVAEFVAPPGTIADVNILAASPIHSGQIKFIVNVSLPQ